MWLISTTEFEAPVGKLLRIYRLVDHEVHQQSSALQDGPRPRDTSLQNMGAMQFEYAAQI